MIPVMRATLAMLSLLACLVLAPLAPAVAAVAAVHVKSVVALSESYGGGVAALGDTYTFAGTDGGLNRVLDVIDQRHDSLAARLPLPGLTSYGLAPLSMEMTDLEMAPDNRTLYILNQKRRDIVALDVTGRTAPRAIPIAEDRGRRLVVSPDGQYLAVLGDTGATIVRASDGAAHGTVPWATSLVWGRDLTWYILAVKGTHANVYVYTSSGHPVRGVSLPAGTSMTAPNGSLALSPDGRTLYVLWNGLRALALPSLGLKAGLQLPAVPAYTGLTIAPNGRQAMLWAPFFSSSVDSPSVTPGYVNVSSGWVSGGVQPVALPALRPAPADRSLRTISAPQQVAYSGDSARAYVTTERNVAVLATGTSGKNLEPAPPVDLQRMATGPTLDCTNYAVNGAWIFSFLPGAPAGRGTGTATLMQNGSALMGTLDVNGLTWTISGSIQGTSVTLTLSAPGQAASTIHAAVASDGASIVGDIAILRGHAACGIPHQVLPNNASPTPTAQPTGGPALNCREWNVNGTWTLYFTSGSDSKGVYQGGNDLVKTSVGRLESSGPDISGSFQDPFDGLTYTLTFHGPLQGNTWAVTTGAPGQIDLNWHAAISPDGRLINAGIGVLHGQASCAGATAGGSSRSGGTPPQATDTPTAQPTTTSCQTMNVGGMWTFTGSSTSSIGTGSTTVTLSQSGTTVTGAIQLGGVSWTIQGVVQGATLTLTWSASGQIDQTDTDTIAADGTSIAGNFGTFSGGHAHC
jgi:hypothetical protein